MAEAGNTVGAAAPSPHRLISDDDLVRRFTYHPPDDRRVQLHREVDHLTLMLARQLVALTPAGRGQSLALTALEEVRMRANQAIATGE